MRYVCCTMAVCLLVGCQGKTASLRNPFLSPDRVPPPATRTLLPGTAQPYYPGDPIPNAAPTYAPGAIGAPVPTSPPTVPPGGWNPSPQSNVLPSSYNVTPVNAEIPLGPVATANESPIRINTDQQNLRFPQVSPLLSDSFQTPSAQTPPQSVLPSPYQNQQPRAQVATQPVGFQTPIAQSQYVQPAQFPQTPPTQFLGIQTPSNQGQRAVQIRPIKSPSPGSSTAPSAQDGFRPQGSRLIRRSKPVSQDSRRDSPTPTGFAPLEFGPVREVVERFGFDPQYQWLRGQLQYTQASNQWQLRYLPVQGGADQFGGQVFIANPQVLGTLRPGDYVQVRGKLTAQPTGAGVYTVSIVQRQRVQ